MRYVTSLPILRLYPLVTKKELIPEFVRVNPLIRRFHNTVIESQTFWPIDCEQGDPDLFVCMQCLNEVFRSKVPRQGCPGCGAVSTFEPFTLHSIQEWGTEELISKARMEADSGTHPELDPHPSPLTSEDPLST